MDLSRTFGSQYLAALEMLRLAVEACPDTSWESSEGGKPFWHVAYHTLFFTDLYLSPSESEFRPWREHHDEAQFLGRLPWEGNRLPRPVDPYTRAEILDYHRELAASVVARLAGLDPEAPSGFSWLPFTKLELQIYNIRHVQHHAAQLISRLRQTTNAEIRWVGYVPPAEAP